MTCRLYRDRHSFSSGVELPHGHDAWDGNRHGIAIFLGLPRRGEPACRATLEPPARARARGHGDRAGRLQRRGVLLHRWLLAGVRQPVRGQHLLRSQGRRPGYATVAGYSFDLLHLHEPLIPSVSMLALLYSRCANLATFHAAREGGALGYRLARPVAETTGREDRRARGGQPRRPGPGLPLLPGRLPHPSQRRGYRDIFSPRGPMLDGLEEEAFHLVFVGRDGAAQGIGGAAAGAAPGAGETPRGAPAGGGSGGDPADASEGVKWLGRLPDAASPPPTAPRR